MEQAAQQGTDTQQAHAPGVALCLTSPDYGVEVHIVRTSTGWGVQVWGADAQCYIGGVVRFTSEEYGAAYDYARWLIA